MPATDARSRRARAWGALGGGVLAAAAVAVLVAALLNHGIPTGGVHTLHSSSPLPTTAASATPSAPAPTSTAPPVVVVTGPPLHGFVPSDVTAISAAEWWVLGFDRTSCSAATCTRIAQTVDAGHTFTSVAVPPVAPGGTLRFADALNGWLASGTGALWTTHDAGAHWTHDGNAGSVTDVEASGGAVYAIACTGASSCVLERSPVGRDAWTVLPAAGHGALSRLTLNGGNVWMEDGSGSTSLLASPDGGQHFAVHSVCHDAVAIAGLYAVSADVVWATCATGTQAAVYRSLDGGATFAQAGAPGIANFATVAGVSSSTAVAAAQELVRTSDGGRSFTTVAGEHADWTIRGFTTSMDGFAMARPLDGTSNQLWRSDDAGAHWHEVRLP